MLGRLDESRNCFLVNRIDGIEDVQGCYLKSLSYSEPRGFGHETRWMTMLPCWRQGGPGKGSGVQRTNKCRDMRNEPAGSARRGDTAMRVISLATICLAVSNAQHVSSGAVMACIHVAVANGRAPGVGRVGDPSLKTFWLVNCKTVFSKIVILELIN